LILIIPLGDSSKYFPVSEYFFPPPLIEVKGRMMIDLVVENILNAKKFEKMIFVVRDIDCRQHYLDTVLSNLVDCDVEVVRLQKQTAGALCSILLSVDKIDPESPIIISNGDQIFTNNLADYLSNFENLDIDAGCLVFDSSHPRWSYVRCNFDGRVTESSIHKPISRKAIAGIYYFAKAKEFFKYSFQVLSSGASDDGKYYVASVFNQYCLDGKRVQAFDVENSEYVSLYTPQRIKDYELKMGEHR
jgi:dTDP-glucose pyrophosphorylase